MKEWSKRKWGNSPWREKGGIPVDQLRSNRIGCRLMPILSCLQKEKMNSFLVSFVVLVAIPMERWENVAIVRSMAFTILLNSFSHSSNKSDILVSIAWFVACERLLINLFWSIRLLYAFRGWGVCKGRIDHQISKDSLFWYDFLPPPLRRRGILIQRNPIVGCFNRNGRIYSFIEMIWQTIR